MRCRIWCTTLKPGQGVDVGPGMMRVVLSGITRSYAIIKCIVGTNSLTVEVPIERGVRINKNVSLKLFKISRQRRATMGFDVSEGTKCVKFDTNNDEDGSKP